MTDWCQLCGQAIKDGDDTVENVLWTVHATCWGEHRDTCGGCGRPIEFVDDDVRFGDDGKVYHGQCYIDFEIDGQQQE